MTKQGAIPVWVGKCNYCNSEYEAKLSDLNYEPGNRMLAEPEHTATCELCKKKVYFKKMETRRA